MTENDVLAVFDALLDAATKGRDAGAAAALFAQDEDVTMWGSEEPEQALGPQAVRALLDAIVASEASLEFGWEERRVRVEGDAAWLNAAGSFTLDGATSAYRATAVFVRREGRWLLHTFNGSEPR